jgi:hypothetical protein
MEHVVNSCSFAWRGSVVAMLLLSGSLAAAGKMTLSEEERRVGLVVSSDGLVLTAGPAGRAGLHGGDVPIQVEKEHILGAGGEIVLTMGGESPMEWAKRAAPAPKKPGDLQELKPQATESSTDDPSRTRSQRPTWRPPPELLCTPFDGTSRAHLHSMSG